jgi:hypothetical protein
MSSVSDQCYMCDSPATSREHVPPKCIFPEQKDMAGQDYRSDLITVASCDVHNLRKAKDDEFLMVSLAGILGNNSIGYRHKLTKVNRAIRRSAGRLLDAVFKARKHFVVKTNDNAFIEVIWGTPDYSRLECCFSHVALGLYFHQFGERFRGQHKILMSHLHHSEKNPATFSRFIQHKAQIDLVGIVPIGRNPDVFYYQFSAPDQFGILLLRMCFYQGVDIFVSFIPEGTEIPGNFAMRLIQSGIKTYIGLGDATYEFN